MSDAFEQAILTKLDKALPFVLGMIPPHTSFTAEARTLRWVYAELWPEKVRRLEQAIACRYPVGRDDPIGYDPSQPTLAEAMLP